MVASAACAFATFSTKMKFMNMKMKNNVQQTQNRKSLQKVIVVEKLLLLLDRVLARSLLLRCFSRGEKRNQGFESGVAGVVRIDFFASGMIILSVQH
jgi:hypothetical protein